MTYTVSTTIIGMCIVTFDTTEEAQSHARALAVRRPGMRVTIKRSDGARLVMWFSPFTHTMEHSIQQQ